MYNPFMARLGNAVEGTFGKVGGEEALYTFEIVTHDNQFRDYIFVDLTKQGNDMYQYMGLFPIYMELSRPHRAEVDHYVWQYVKHHKQLL